MKIYGKIIIDGIPIITDISIMFSNFFLEQVKSHISGEHSIRFLHQTRRWQEFMNHPFGRWNQNFIILLKNIFISSRKRHLSCEKVSSLRKDSSLFMKK